MTVSTMEEDAIIQDFLHGPLTRWAAVEGLMGLALSRDDAERLLDEAVDAYEADKPRLITDSSDEIGGNS